MIFFANFFSGSLNQYPKVFNVHFRWLIGGVFGALIIYLVTRTIPRLGITVTLTLVVASQILSSFFIDTCIFRYEKIELTKIFGALLVIAGVYFIVD